MKPNNYSKQLQYDYDTYFCLIDEIDEMFKIHIIALHLLISQYKIMRVSVLDHNIYF